MHSRISHQQLHREISSSKPTICWIYIVIFIIPKTYNRQGNQLFICSLKLLPASCNTRKKSRAIAIIIKWRFSSQKGYLHTYYSKDTDLPMTEIQSAHFYSILNVMLHWNDHYKPAWQQDAVQRSINILWKRIIYPCAVVIYANLIDSFMIAIADVTLRLQKNISMPG